MNNINQMKQFVISDIHGGFKALYYVLKKANFDFETDQLICLGDCHDGWPEVKECFELLFKIKHLIYIWGNHDQWAFDYYSTCRYHAEKDNRDMIYPDNYFPAGTPLMSKQEFFNWERQGGKGTLKSFGTEMMSIEASMILEKAKNYYIDEDNRIFVHGGFDIDMPIEHHSREHLIWDRDLISKVKYKQIMHEKHGHPNKISKYDEIYIGHTPTLNFGTSLPLQLCNLWNIDTGASYDGPLTLMRIDEKLSDGKWNHQIWQSEPVMNYYPGIKARG